MSNAPNPNENPPGPHAGQPVATAGLPLREARAAIVLVHGRGAPAESIIELSESLDLPRFAVLAPQAAGHTWYPNSFLAPLPSNQPWLDSALASLDHLINKILAADIPSQKIALLGFSQGACLTTEFAARHPRRYGAIVGLTGGLIGPPRTPRNYPGAFAGTPVFLGSGDPDPHVPFNRVEETRDVLTRMGASVELRRYPGMPHGINEDELAAVQTLLSAMAK